MEQNHMSLLIKLNDIILIMIMMRHKGQLRFTNSVAKRKINLIPNYHI